VLEDADSAFEVSPIDGSGGRQGLQEVASKERNVQGQEARSRDVTGCARALGCRFTALYHLTRQTLAGLGDRGPRNGTPHRSCPRNGTPWCTTRPSCRGVRRRDMRLEEATQ
jgi:hypothetical protein